MARYWRSVTLEQRVTFRHIWLTIKAAQRGWHPRCLKASIGNMSSIYKSFQTTAVKGPVTQPVGHLPDRLIRHSFHSELPESCPHSLPWSVRGDLRVYDLHQVEECLLKWFIKPSCSYMRCDLRDWLNRSSMFWMLNSVMLFNFSLRYLSCLLISHCKRNFIILVKVISVHLFSRWIGENKSV